MPNYNHNCFRPDKLVCGNDEAEQEQTIDGLRRWRRNGRAQKIEEENMSEVFVVRGFQGGRIQRLDSGAARVRGVLLPRLVHVPVGKPLERDQPRGHADVDELGQSEGRVQGVLRSHQVAAGDVPLRGRRGKSGGEKLLGYDRRGMWM